MKAVKMILAGGVVIAALASAAPASAQYYPGYGYGYGGNPVGQVINQVFGGGGGYGGGYNQQAAVNQCAAAVQQRLSGGYGAGYGYGGGDNSGYNNGYAYVGGRVLGISRVEPRSNGLVVRGVATTGNNAAYGYNAQAPVDLTWSCRTDYRGYIANVDIHPAQRNWGQSYGGYTPYNNYSNDYSQYGYRRY
jgi:hypothetical protein